MFGVDLQQFFLRSLKSAFKRRIRRNKYFRGGSMLRRLFVGFFLYFREDYKLHRSTRLHYNKYTKKKYKKLRNTKFREYCKENDFAYKRGYSIDAFRLISRFYRTNRGVLRNKIPVFRGLALRAHLERAATKWKIVRQLFEAIFLRHVYAPFFSWLAWYVEYLVSNIFILSDKSSVSFQYFSIIM